MSGWWVNYKRQREGRDKGGKNKNRTTVTQNKIKLKGDAADAKWQEYGGIPSTWQGIGKYNKRRAGIATQSVGSSRWASQLEKSASARFRRVPSLSQLA